MSSKHDIEALLLGYQSYLMDKDMLGRSAKKYAMRLRYFISWTDEQGHQEIRYPEMTAYIRYCQDTGMKTRLINCYLRSVRHFFDYMNTEGIRYLNPIQDYNPVTGIQIRGVIKKIRTDYLKEEELEELYEKYKGKDKILLGLFVYQGLKVGEIERLEKIHFDLQKGTVYVPATRRGNSRTLRLATPQLYDLMQHMMTIEGPEILTTKYLQNYAQRLCKKLREINPKVQSSIQLRGSRISYWVRTHNIRKAQYLAGHTTIMGTERYKRMNLEDLQKQVNMFHPLK